MKHTVLNTTLNEILHENILFYADSKLKQIINTIKEVNHTQGQIGTHSEVALQYRLSPSCQTQTKSNRVITDECASV